MGIFKTEMGNVAQSKMAFGSSKGEPCSLDSTEDPIEVCDM